MAKKKSKAAKAKIKPKTKAKKSGIKTVTAKALKAGAPKTHAHNCTSCGGGCSGPNAGAKDVLHGMYISYDPETGVYIESNYDNGLEHGERVEYFDIETEFVKSRGYFDRGLKEGQWIFYKKDGSVDRIESYAKGRKKK